MSVINQVLKDLDKRGATGNLEDPSVRVVYRRSSRDILVWMLTGAIGMLLLGGIVWALYSLFFQREAAPLIPIAEMPVRSTAVTPASAVPAMIVIPEITSTTPVIMMATGKPQKLVIHGRNFDKVNSVTLQDGLGIEYPNREILSRTDSMLELRINAGRTAGIWKVVLLDAGKQAGKPFSFEVRLPGTGNEATTKSALTHPAPAKSVLAIPSTEPAAAQLEKHPTRINLQQQAENEYRRSLQLQRLGQVNEAMNGFENALKLDPGHEPARLAMATVMIGRQQMEDTEKLLHEGLQASVQQTRLAFLLARLQVERKDIGGALATLQGSQQYAINQGEYLAFHAVLLQKLERHHDAVEYFTKALQLSPKNGVWLMGLGISLRADKRNEEALAAFQKALDNNSLSAELRNFVTQQMKELEQIRQ